MSGLSRRSIGAHRRARCGAEWGEDDERVVAQDVDREPRIIGDVDREREVGLVGQDVVDQLVEVIGLGQPNVDVRDGAAHSGQHVREQLGRGRLERADDEAAGQAPPEHVELFVHPVDAAEHRACVIEHHPTGGGQLRGTRPALAVEQRHACGALELADLLADRGLREAEIVGGSCERAGLDNRDEGGQLARIGVAERRHQSSAYRMTMSRDLRLS